MLTSKRRETIQEEFNEHCNETGLYELDVAYRILFTREEREHLTYDLFLEDWDAWLSDKNNQGSSKDKMTVEIALNFLEKMQ